MYDGILSFLICIFAGIGFIAILVGIPVILIVIIFILARGGEGNSGETN